MDGAPSGIVDARNRVGGAESPGGEEGRERGPYDWRETRS